MNKTAHQVIVAQEIEEISILAADSCEEERRRLRELLRRVLTDAKDGRLTITDTTLKAVMEALEEGR